MTTATASRTIAVAAVALLGAAALAYWLFGANQAREMRKATLASVADAAARMREALTIEAGPASADGAETVRKLDEHAAAVERRLAGLKRLEAGRDPALADAADYYLVTAREILKRQADSHRYRLLLSESFQALRDHMRSDNRTGSWVKEAVKARERVNRDFRGYSLAAGALDQILRTFGPAQDKIAPYLEASALIPASLVEEARAKNQAELRRLTAEIERSRQPDAFR